MDWGSNIVLDIARRQCVLYLGSGVSHNSKNAAGDHPMTWREFLLKGSERGCLNNKQKKEIKDKVKTGDYLLACELLKRYLGNDDFTDLLEESFKKPQFSEADIHKEIFIAYPLWNFGCNKPSRIQPISTIPIQQFHATNIGKMCMTNFPITIFFNNLFWQIDIIKNRISI